MKMILALKVTLSAKTVRPKSFRNSLMLFCIPVLILVDGKTKDKK